MIFLHVKIVIAMYGFSRIWKELLIFFLKDFIIAMFSCSGVAGATPLHSTIPPGMLTL